MTSNQPPLTPLPAPPINIPGLSCTGTMCGSHVNYECQTTPVECARLTSHEFEHLLKPHFWISAVLILYVVVVVSKASSEGAYQLFLGALTKFRLGRPRPRSRVTQIAALLVYLVILWLVWLEEYMVLDTEWRVARKVLAVWFPRPTPLRLRLLVLYPVWAVISALWVVVVGLTVAAGVYVTKVQLGCVKEMASLVMGSRELDSRVLSGEIHVGGDRDGEEEKKVYETEATKSSAPLDEKSQG
ncbi:hypothetical protein CHU98_g7250 [Xylaria longipes]|nr:hypothetical protein CHU98_g7250 [Xylaria longipes]